MLATLAESLAISRQTVQSKGMRMKINIKKIEVPERENSLES